MNDPKLNDGRHEARQMQQEIDTPVRDSDLFARISF